MTENLRTRNNAMVKSLGLLPASHISDLETPTGTDRKKNPPNKSLTSLAKGSVKGHPTKTQNLLVQFSSVAQLCLTL